MFNKQRNQTKSLKITIKKNKKHHNFAFPLGNIQPEFYVVHIKPKACHWVN